MPFTLQKRHLEGSKTSPEPIVDLPSPEPGTELGAAAALAGRAAENFSIFLPDPPGSYPTSTRQVPDKYPASP